jgi:cyclase
MLTRIIPRLDIKSGNLVKGIHLEGLRVLGKPEVFARTYYEQGADELLFVDVVASLYGRNSLLDIIERTANEIFIPLCVAGGLRTLDDIRAVLRAGADKIALNTAAIARPELISEAARHFGSSTIVVSIEAIRVGQGRWEALTDNGREKTGLDAVEWAKRVANLGAGELLVTSIDQEGTGRGYDIELTSSIANAVTVPVIACGGAGTMRHVSDVLESGATAAAMASLLHYNAIRHRDMREDDYSAAINLAHLDRPGFGRIEDARLPDLKHYLATRGVESRQLRNDPSNG